MEDKLLNLFRIKNLTELAFVIFLMLIVFGMIIMGQMAFTKRYSYHKIDYSTDEVFVNKMGGKTLFIVKDTDPRSNYPRIQYKIIENNKTIEHAQIVIGEFEIYPNAIIFEEVNETVKYVDQYQKDYLIPKEL